MAGYVPNCQKKIRIANKREHELLHALRHGLPQEKIEEAAEALRLSKLAVYKAQWAAASAGRLADYSDAAEAVNNKHVAKWLDASIETIVEWYVAKIG